MRSFIFHRLCSRELYADCPAPAGRGQVAPDPCQSHPAAFRGNIKLGVRGNLRDERPIMTEEDISVPSGRFVRDSSLAEFERALETLIVLAHSQGPNFLAYLLIMALMHLREEEDQGRPEATH